MEQNINYKGYRIKIRPDESCESPNYWGNTDMFLIYEHKEFCVKRKGFKTQDIYESGLAYEEIYWIFPVEAYIHSGVSLSLFSGTKRCKWDSSISGYVLASKKEFKDLETAKTAAKGLIETWNQYLSGEVYGFIIEKPIETYLITEDNLKKILTADDYNNDIIHLNQFKELSYYDVDWDEVDSCWGFYGEDYCIEEAKAVIDNLVKNE